MGCLAIALIDTALPAPCLCATIIFRRSVSVLIVLQHPPRPWHHPRRLGPPCTSCAPPRADEHPQAGSVTTGGACSYECLADVPARPGHAAVERGCGGADRRASGRPPPYLQQQRDHCHCREWTARGRSHLRVPRRPARGPARCPPPRSTAPRPLPHLLNLTCAQKLQPATLSEPQANPICLRQDMYLPAGMFDHIARGFPSL